MAMQSFQLDPSCVTQAAFNAHVHNYRKLTRVGADSDDKWGSPTWADVIDDGDTHVEENVDLEACGVTTATAPCSTPV